MLRPASIRSRLVRELKDETDELWTVLCKLLFEPMAASEERKQSDKCDQFLKKVSGVWGSTISKVDTHGGHIVGKH